MMHGIREPSWTALRGVPAQLARPSGAADARRRTHDWRTSSLRLLQVTWPFLVTVLLLLALAAVSFQLMSAGRAYVHGESLWSKGQKNAIQFLARYNDSCDRRNFEQYQSAMAVPMGDRIARLELLQPAPNWQRITTGFVQGGNHPDDIPGMVTLFRQFGSVPLLHRAIQIWGDAEQLLLQLDADAQTLDRQIHASCQDNAAHQAMMAKIYALNDRLTPLQDAFSDTLGRANRMIQTVLLLAMSTASLLLTLIGISLARRIVRRGTDAERALAHSDRRHQLAVSGSNQGLWDFDLRSGELFVSPGFQRLLGHANQPIHIGHADITQLLHPDEREGVLTTLRAHQLSGRRFTEELRLRTSDGSYRWYSVAGQSLMDDAGRPMRFVGSIHDVTERRQLRESHLAELKLRRSAAATLRAILAATAPPGSDNQTSTGQPSDDIDAVIREVSALAARQRAANEDLAAILSLSPDGFVSFDSAQQVHHVSPAFTSITGIAADDVLGRDVQAFTEHLNRRCRPEAGLPTMTELRRRGSQVPTQLELDGSCRRVLTAELREGAQGAVRSVLCLRDVTREHEIERLKSEFMTTAAHELRTPMASIYGFAELMLHRTFDAGRRNELLGIVHRQARQMVGIIDDLLDLSRLQARQTLDLVPERLDLAGLVNEVLEALPCPAGRPGPELQHPAATLPVIGDRTKLTRVLNNLLSNAYKYSPGAGPVCITLLDQADQAGFCIKDQGIGMTPAQLQRFGERFYRADMSGNIPGTGLGVSIVREIVQLHDGTLAVESMPGQGTSVTVMLPRAPAA